MSDVFISYSRSDKVFVNKLFLALENEGHDTWVDWEDIDYAEDWWQKICAGIEAADNFVFVHHARIGTLKNLLRMKLIMPSNTISASFPFCTKKLPRRLDHQRMHPAISKHNWLPLHQ